MAELKTKYRFIHFEQNSMMGDPNPFWDCLNTKHSEILGRAEYYPLWKQWVFNVNTFADMIFSYECLNNIADFLQQLNGTKSESEPEKELTDDDPMPWGKYGPNKKKLLMKDLPAKYLDLDPDQKKSV